MSVRKYLIYCEICNHKQYTDGSDSFYEIKSSPIPQGEPYVDPFTKKVVKPVPKAQMKKIKCPGCGRGVTPKLVKNNEKNQSDGSKTSPERLKIQRESTGGIQE